MKYSQLTETERYQIYRLKKAEHAIPAKGLNMAI